ncbi:hypothetical protein SJAG_04764 [Schizosaccharomyces japonicus yFS275]|uniref:Uncharacterized protein n=1 Tax=Schizosaccharomyces japonicus (strain yFS275 / FY16936) TaxID=402676 RepID=B6K7P8_SCHJY|nr:hypothetical protein SJAG_04764 [Schizosaccharomyces japonicus yFS275]EEB09552.1 hypothetical protein SJAG_04764 [Schizosaccharomyces japonicus yFS275]
MRIRTSKTVQHRRDDSEESTITSPHSFTEYMNEYPEAGPITEEEGYSPETAVKSGAGKNELPGLGQKQQPSGKVSLTSVGALRSVFGKLYHGDNATNKQTDVIDEQQQKKTDKTSNGRQETKGKAKNDVPEEVDNDDDLDYFQRDMTLLGGTI